MKELQPEGAAFGAAEYRKDWQVVDQLDEVRVEVGISASEISQENQRERGARLATVRIAREGRSLGPTHIVCDGLAYELVGNSFSIELTKAVSSILSPVATKRATLWDSAD